MRHTKRLISPTFYTFKQPIQSATMSDSNKPAKTVAAEEIIDQFLASPTNVIGSKEEEAVIALMRKLPSGMDEKCLFEALKRIGPLKLFRFAAGFSTAYIPVLREVMRMIYLKDTFTSRMMNQCLAFALEKEFSEPGAEQEYRETAAFLQYLSTFSFPVDKAENFKTSDKYITTAVGEHVARTLATVPYQSRDIRVFNSFIYALGKSNHPLVETVFQFQIGNNTKLQELNSFLLALAPNKTLSNTAKGYQLAYDKLAVNQKASLADEVIKAIGIETEIGQKWSFMIQLSSDPTEKKPKRGWFVSIEISNQWTDCIQLNVKGPKGVAKGNERHGVLMSKGLGFLKIDLFNLHENLDEIGRLYGIEKFYWENVDVSVKGLDRTAVKQIRNWVK
ncbi:hypothetical protein D3C87_196310 [compost metagenome]